VAAGGRHSLAISADGRLWAWGSNQYGQLGLGDREDRGIPERVPGFGPGTDLKAVGISTGYEHSLVIVHSVDGISSLYSMGRGQDGRLGIDEFEDALSPTAAPVADKFSHQPPGHVSHVAAGRHHSIAFAPQVDPTSGLDEALAEPPKFPHPPIFACGANSYGQLAIGDSGERHEWCFFVGMRGKFIHHLERDGCAMLTAGSEYSVCVTKRGGVWVCGRGDGGQLGSGHAALMKDYGKMPATAIFHFQEVGGGGGELLTGSFLHGRLDARSHPPSVVYEDVLYTKR